MSKAVVSKHILLGLCLLVEVNVFPSTEKIRRLQLPHGAPPSTTTSLVFLPIYEALSLPRWKPNFITCCSACTECTNKYLYQYPGCLHEEAFGSSVCWLLAEF